MERFLDYFVPEKYNLALEIDKMAKTIGGRVIVQGVAKASEIKFHAVGLTITKVSVNGKKADFRQEDGALIIAKVPRGALTVRMEYHGMLNENMEGAYLSTYECEGETEVIVATQFESHYAREAFPCVDEPAAKAVFELAITVPEEWVGDTVLANTPILRLEERTTVFEPTPRMSTYLLAFVVGPLCGRNVTNKNGVEITTYAARNQDLRSLDFANEVAARALEFYDKEFGVRYPLKKLDQVALPDFEAGAMENWGLVTYRESMLLVPKSASLATKKSVATTVAHELAHQWFGDLVTMAWWDDLWLNESFASVMEYYAVDRIYPDFRIWEDFYTSDVLLALKRDALPGVQSVHQEVESPEEIATLFDGAIVYAKGARLMLMLIREMGWVNFCQGIRGYFEKFTYGNATGDDLWKCLQPFCEFRVGEMMHAFIDRPGYPVLTAKGEVKAKKKLPKRSEEEDYYWTRLYDRIDVIREEEFATYEQWRFLLEGKMEKSDWPLPEVKEGLSGHYVLNLTEKQLNERVENLIELTEDEKLRLLIDRSLVTKTKLAASASLLPLLKTFSEEDDAAIWDVMAMVVSELKVFFTFGSPEEKQFKQFVRELTKWQLTRIGIRTMEPNDEVARLRSTLLALEYYAEDRETIERLAELYGKDLVGLDAELREDILCAKIYVEPKIYDEYLEQYQKIVEPEIRDELLSAMTIAKDERVVAKALKLLGRLDVVKLQDQLYLFARLYRNPVARERAGAWLRENWDEVAKLAGDKSVESYPRLMAAAAKTEQERDEFRAFFGPKREEPALARAIEVGEREIEARLKLIREDQAGVYAELGALQAK